jgi:hypothetical protein
MLMDNFISTGRLDPTIILCYALEEMPAIYKAFDKKTGGIPKVFVETKFSSSPAVGTPALTTIARALDQWRAGGSMQPTSSLLVHYQCPSRSVQKCSYSGYSQSSAGMQSSKGNL